MNAHDAPLAAVLWDMDGTLIDTEPFWIGAERELAGRFSVDWTHDDGLQLVGNPLTVSAEVLQARGVDMSVDDIIDTLLASVTAEVRAGVPWQPDAKRLLDELVDAGVRCALVTMSYGVLARAMLDAVPGVFEVVVTGDEVANGKPHPEPYLTSAARLGVDVADCVAIEDSPAGTGSAHAAGAITLAVKRDAVLEPRPGMSRVRTLDGLGVAGLLRLRAGEVIDELGDEV